MVWRVTSPGQRLTLPGLEGDHEGSARDHRWSLCAADRVCFGFFATDGAFCRLPRFQDFTAIDEGGFGPISDDRLRRVCVAMSIHACSLRGVRPFPF
jgi:hypothetical protein